MQLEESNKYLDFLRVSMRIRKIIELGSFLLSDGGVSPRGKKSWTIYLRNKDRKIIEEFQNLLKQLSGRTGYIIHKPDGTHIVKIHNKELGDELLNVFNTLRTTRCETYPSCRKRNVCKRCNEKRDYPHITIPKILYESRKLSIKFIRNYISCDGGVGLSIGLKNKSYFLVRKVFIECKNPGLKENLITLLENLGYTPKTYGNQIRLTTKKDIIKFKKEIGFIKGCKITKHSQRFKGKEKNWLLSQMIKSYQNPKEFIQVLL